MPVETIDNAQQEAAGRYLEPEWMFSEEKGGALVGSKRA